ncbi:LysR substrate-binding domain-containing protein [Paracoccus versutus]
MRDRETPRWEVIASEVFLVPSRGTGAELDVYFQGKLSGRGGDRRMWIQSVGRESLLDMVSGGFCVALLLSSAAQRRREGVGSIPLAELQEPVRFSAVCSQPHANPVARRLLEMARRKAGNRGPENGLIALR